MTSEKQSIGDKLLNLNSNWIHLAMAILVLWPLANPFFLPIPIGETTQDYFDVIEALPDGAAVMLMIHCEPGNIPEVGDAAVTTLSHLAREVKDVKIVHMVTVRPDHAIVFDSYIKPRVDWGDLVYGENWVFLGYAEGGEVATRTFGEDTHALFDSDYYGTSLDQLDIMDDLRSADDFDLIIGKGQGVVAQIVVPFGIPCIAPTTSWGWAEAMADYLAGNTQGALNGIRGSAEYSSLTKIPSPSVAGMDATNATHLFLLAVAIITNGIYLFRKIGGTA